MSSTRPGDARAARAEDAAELLQGDEPGVLLVGPAAQTSHAIRLILDQLSDRSVMPVGFAAYGATPAMLRQEVGQAHAARPSPDTDLLLVVAQADRLSPDLLHELEMAAEAAATHGGLKFLFAAPRDLSAALQRAELWSLAACIRTRLPILPPTLPTGQETDPLAIQPVSGRPYPVELVGEPLGVPRHARPAGPAPRIMLAIGILGMLGLALAGVLIEHQAIRPATFPAQASAPPIAAAPTAATPPPATPVPLSSAPPEAAPPVVAAPVTEAPAPASPGPASPVQEPAAPAPPASASPAPEPAAPEIPAPNPPALASPTPASPVPAPPVVVPPRAPAASSAATPTAFPPPDAGVAPDRIATGQIVPQMAPAQHASLLLMAGPGDTLPTLYAQVYRGTTPPAYAQVMTLNPVVRPGVRLVFPAPPTGWPAASPP